MEVCTTSSERRTAPRDLLRGDLARMRNQLDNLAAKLQSARLSGNTVQERAAAVASDELLESIAVAKRASDRVMERGL